MKFSVFLAAALLLQQGALARPETTGSFIAAYAKEHNFNGTILVQKEGKTSFVKSFGLANIPF